MKKVNGKKIWMMIENSGFNGERKTEEKSIKVSCSDISEANRDKKKFFLRTY